MGDVVGEGFAVATVDVDVGVTLVGIPDPHPVTPKIMDITTIKLSAL